MQLGPSRASNLRSRQISRSLCAGFLVSHENHKRLFKLPQERKNKIELAKQKLLPYKSQVAQCLNRAPQQSATTSGNLKQPWKSFMAAKYGDKGHKDVITETIRPKYQADDGSLGG
ncbi:hypothetical protein BTUL_0292g00090 [Botrytis tulipae]|uniref:Uncharacterized protein n=1 Tax=Botrytis tulipae TaxID=87230 RepID=A0A4Z1E9T2_9HELO|nr:hypothetical protein BTUL_0292g00090 [Botrytis tulipae]